MHQKTKKVFSCLECGVVCHTKCAGLVPDFCGMSMEKANLMLSEMKAANNRRRTIYSDTVPQITIDKPLFTSTSSNTQQQQPHLYHSSLDSNLISPQASFSTPVSPKLNATTPRPLSFAHDSASFQSLGHIFSQTTISDALSKSGSHQLVSESIVQVHGIKYLTLFSHTI